MHPRGTCLSLTPPKIRNGRLILCTVDDDMNGLFVKMCKSNCQKKYFSYTSTTNKSC